MTTGLVRLGGARVRVEAGRRPPREIPLARNSDMLDVEWLAALLEHGYCGAVSFPTADPQLQDLTRYRKRLLRARASECQRIQKTLEDAGIKPNLVASDVLGASGRGLRCVDRLHQRGDQVVEPDPSGIRRWQPQG
jgi:transposase